VINKCLWGTARGSDPISTGIREGGREGRDLNLFLTRVPLPIVLYYHYDYRLLLLLSCSPSGVVHSTALRGLRLIRDSRSLSSQCFEASMIALALTALVVQSLQPKGRTHNPVCAVLRQLHLSKELFPSARDA
jgi:hypothetical protein